jgi:hypothetical protein
MKRGAVMKAQKRLLFFGIFFVWVVAGVCSQALAEQAIFHSYSKSLALPEIVLEDLDGKTVRIQDQPGKVILLNFWATW